MLNQRSNYLVILIATYNRLDLLKQSLSSIAAGTRCSHEIIVIDGGSTDGTIDYLASHSGITPVFQGELLGAARAYNQVWQQIDSRYTCWLSDDTEVVPGSLDLAVRILESRPQIGMVGLKMRDTIGVGKSKPYMGARSIYGIINCNHGVLPTRLLRDVGYFNENYRTYGIDPDLTASVLCTGKQVVLTKQASILHHRAGIVESNTETNQTDDSPNVNLRDAWVNVYQQKFKFLDVPIIPYDRTKAWLTQHLKPILFPPEQRNSHRLGFSYRDWRNLIKGRFVSPLDPIQNLFHPYYLTQQIPLPLLRSDANPYRDLVEQSR